jgi:hypothetical protein
MSLDFFWHQKHFHFLRVDFYRLLRVRKDATNREIVSAFMRIEKLLSKNNIYAKIHFSLLYDGVRMLLHRKGRVYYDTFHELIRYRDECIDIELFKKLNKKPQQNPKRFLIFCKDEFLQNLDGAVRKTRKSDHIKLVMKEEWKSLSDALVIGAVRLFVLFFIYFVLSFI